MIFTIFIYIIAFFVVLIGGLLGHIIGHMIGGMAVDRHEFDDTINSIEGRLDEMEMQIEVSEDLRDYYFGESIKDEIYNPPTRGIKEGDGDASKSS